MKRAILPTVILSLLPAYSFCAPLPKALVFGKIFSVSGGNEQDFIIAYNGHAFQPDDGASFAGVRSILSDGVNTFVIVSETGGGSASSLQFRIVDVSNTDKPVISDLMGESVGDYLIQDWQLKDGGLSAIFEADDGTFNIFCSFKGGKSTIIKKSKLEDLVGPDVAPGGDPAVFANDKSILTAFQQKFLALKLQKILPQDVYAEARKIAYQNQTTLFQSSHGAVAAKASAKYDDGQWISIAIEHDGTVSARFSWGNNKATYYGNPSELVKFAL